MSIEGQGHLLTFNTHISSLKSFIDLGPMSFIDKDLTFFSQKPLAHFQPNFE